MFARDTPLFPAMDPGLRAKIFSTMCSALERLRTEYDVVIVEGAGNPTDVGEGDLTNRELAQRFDIATVLITKLSAGGGIASLVGTYQLLPEHARKRVVGYVLNDLLDGTSFAEGLASQASARLGIACLGVLPNLWAIRPWRTREEELDGLADLVESHIDVDALGFGARRKYAS